jgi:hypothetical protein
MVAKKKRQTKKVKSLALKSVSANQARRVKGGRPQESLRHKK